MLINTTLVRTASARSDIKIVGIPATAIARETGNEKTANMVMLGALAVTTKTLALDNTEAFFKEFFPEEKRHFIPINLQAVAAGKKVATAEL